MTIPTLPPYPSRGSAPDTFSLQADAFVAAMPAWGVAVQAVGDAADADATAAAASAAASAASAATANYKGVYSAGTTYQIGQSVTYGSAKFFAKTVNTGVTPVDGANWGLVNEVPAQTGNAGKTLFTDGTNTFWAYSLRTYSYANRGDLRALTPGSGEHATVEGLGLFRWVSGSTGLDDDETAFATASGAWEMIAADPEYVSALSLILSDDINERFLSGSFTMSATSLATITSTSFTATVTGAMPGDHVVVTPGDGFGTAATDKGKLSFAAYVSAPGVVTVTIRNGSASTAAMTASKWSVLVIKP